MVWERAGRLAGLAGGRSGSPLAHSVGTCLHWASPGFSVGVGLIRGQKFSAASLGAYTRGNNVFTPQQLCIHSTFFWTQAASKDRRTHQAPSPR